MEGIKYSEISQKKTNICLRLYIESKNKANEYNKTETDSDTENKLVVTRRQQWKSKLGEAN